MTPIIPPDLWQPILTFFKGDEYKTRLWFLSSNPMLAEFSPLQMVLCGRADKLRQFIEDSLKAG
jgi:hypothetical protein